jgi:glycosyltransferase involved in cell wall biosynthesis
VKLLILSYIYAPDRSPRAYRWSAIAEHWAAQGRQVEVVAAWKPGDPRHEVRGGVTVHRVGGGLVERLRGALGRASHRDGESDSAPASSPRWAARLAKAAYRATARQLFWPDYAFHWYPAARAEARGLGRATGFDAVISVSHPFTPHLVGLAEKRRRPAQRWLVDIGDPFSLLDETPLNNRALYGALNRRAEAAVLGAADAVSVTVERCRADYAVAFPAVAGKIAVIPPLLSLPDAPPSEPSTFAFTQAGLHLACIGTLYRAVRPPDALLALFEALRRRRSDLHLHFFGALNDCEPSFAPYRDEIDRSIHLHGMVPRREIAAVMRSADLLINLGNATPHQLPSKLVEYVASGRPILNLAASPADSSIAFLAGYQAALTVPASDAAAVSTVESVLAYLLAPQPADRETIRRLLEPHTVERVAGRYDALLHEAGRDRS